MPLPRPHSALIAQLIAHNLQAVAKGLRDAGIPEACVEYAGSGDSGDMFDLSFEGVHHARAAEIEVEVLVKKGFGSDRHLMTRAVSDTGNTLKSG